MFADDADVNDHHAMTDDEGDSLTIRVGVDCVYKQRELCAEIHTKH
jgi:hypothetical protein